MSTSGSLGQTKYGLEEGKTDGGSIPTPSSLALNLPVSLSESSESGLFSAGCLLISYWILLLWWPTGYETIEESSSFGRQTTWWCNYKYNFYKKLPNYIGWENDGNSLTFKCELFSYHTKMVPITIQNLTMSCLTLYRTFSDVSVQSFVCWPFSQPGLRAFAIILDINPRHSI